MKFDGKVVLITGAEQGIGRALALGFASHGAAVAVNYPGPPSQAEAVRAAISGMGGTAMTVQADVRYVDQVAAMVSTVEGQLGPIDVLVNNAGIYPRALIVEMDPHEWDDVLNVNLRGAFLCCRAVVAGMMSRRRGRIVNMSSTGVWLPRERGAHYAASKAGVIAFSRVLAMEAAPFGITVNVIAPGVTNTAQPRGELSEEQLRDLGRQIPLGRIAEPEDIVGPVLFLASDYAAFVTGQVLPINGGRFMR